MLTSEQCICDLIGDAANLPSMARLPSLAEHGSPMRLPPSAGSGGSLASAAALAAAALSAVASCTHSRWQTCAPNGIEHLRGSN